MKFPVFSERYALRKIDEVCYLMDPISGDYYELDECQMKAFRLSDGTVSIEEISKKIEIELEEVTDFFEEQSQEGFVCLKEAKKDNAVAIHYVESRQPHFSDVLIEVTGKCNLFCRHCFNSKLNCDEFEQKAMSIEQLKELISQLDMMNVRRIQLSGGEPLTRDDIWEIIDCIDEHKIFLDVISTNATLINPELARKFGERFSTYGALYISLDGITEETYEGLRGEGTFKKIMTALDLLEKEGCRVFINTMAYKGNIGQLEDMYDWILKKKNIMGWRIGLPKVLGRYEDNHKHLEVGFDEVINVFEKILIRWFKDRPKIRLELSDFFRTDALEVGYDVHSAYDHPCKYAMTNASIKPDGKVVFCASLEIYEPAVLGNLVEEGLANVWYGTKHSEYRKTKINDLEVCKDCRYLKMCGGGCRSNALLSYGDIKKPDPRACIAMKALEEKILPIMPEENKQQVLELIDFNKVFELPTGYSKYI